MIALILVNIGLPTVFLLVRLLAHAFAPKSYGPAGGYDVYTGLCTGRSTSSVFIVAATLGCTAGSVDLTEGMFRHLVVTGRSRWRCTSPGSRLVWRSSCPWWRPFTIVSAVCVFAAPTRLNYEGVNVPAGLSRAGLRAGLGTIPTLSSATSLTTDLVCRTFHAVLTARSSTCRLGLKDQCRSRPLSSKLRPC